VFECLYNNQRQQSCTMVNHKNLSSSQSSEEGRKDQEVALESVLVTMTVFLVLISIDQKSSPARFESLLCGRCVPARMPENQYAPYNVSIGPDQIPKLPTLVNCQHLLQKRKKASSNSITILIPEASASMSTADLPLLRRHSESSKALQPFWSG
jgi:hypothetical protein